MQFTATTTSQTLGALASATDQALILSKYPTYNNTYLAVAIYNNDGTNTVYVENQTGTASSTKSIPIPAGQSVTVSCFSPYTSLSFVAGASTIDVRYMIQE